MCKFEDPGILQKKGSLLGKKQREACQVYLTSVDFRFGKVCIDRRAGDLIGRKAIEYITPGIGIPLELVFAIDIPSESEDSIRFDIEANALGKTFQTRNVPRFNNMVNSDPAYD